MKSSLFVILLLLVFPIIASAVPTEFNGLDVTKRMKSGGATFDANLNPCQTCSANNPVTGNSVLQSRGACTKQNNCQPTVPTEATEQGDVSGQGQGG